MPIYELLLTATLQIGLSNPNYNLLSGNTAKVQMVETLDEGYIQKPLIVTTKITKEVTPKPVLSRVSSLNIEMLYADGKNNCVAFAKAQTGIYRPMGNGGRLAIQGTEPQIGSIGVLYGTPHAVVVESVNDGQITFRESNYTKGWITRRTLSLSSFMGFIYS